MNLIEKNIPYQQEYNKLQLKIKDMLDKEFELKSERHSFANQVSNDSKYFNQELPVELWKQLDDNPRDYYDNLAELSDSLIKLYLKYRKPIIQSNNDNCKINQENLNYNTEFVKRMLLLVRENKVVYEVVGEDTKFATDLLIEMLGSKGINNTIDSGRPRLFYNGHFFEVGTEFRLKDGEIMTRDRTNFGYRFKNGEVVGTINWIDLD